MGQKLLAVCCVVCVPNSLDPRRTTIRSRCSRSVLTSSEPRFSLRSRTRGRNGADQSDVACFPEREESGEVALVDHTVGLTVADRPLASTSAT